MSTVVTQRPNLVGGEWTSAASGAWQEVRNPADYDEVVATVPAMTSGDVADVYAAAVEGAGAWGSMPAVARGRVLLRAAALLRERSQFIARELTLEMGKTLAESTAEVAKSADFFEYCAGLGRAPRGEVLSDERAGVHTWTSHEPIGVVLAICPWNDPLLTPARKIAPALISGNAAVLKPASYTPLVSLHLAAALNDAGLPAGVLNTVTGSAREISVALLENPALGAVSFTGSNAVGEQIATALADRRVKFQAELGGKNASVVLADADLDHAVSTIAAAGFAQAGQRCTATSRVIVAEPIAEAFLQRLTARARALVLGPGIDPETTMGPVVALEQRDVVRGFVERAINDDDVAVCAGGKEPAGHLARGSFVSPTVFAGVRDDMEIWREEVFGPVLAVATVPDLETAIASVNRSRFGLATAVFTRDLSAAMTFVDAVQTGQVSVNLPTSGWDVHMPFGGYKDSGSGTKEQGAEGVAWYTRTKTIAVAH
jgi:alpha-ketoglutaric semialdehyde dehydrogenase